MSSAAVDLGLIHRLTNLADINRILHETIAKERSLDVELDQLLSKRAEIERSFLLLNAPTAEVCKMPALYALCPSDNDGNITDRHLTAALPDPGAGPCGLRAAASECERYRPDRRVDQRQGAHAGPGAPCVTERPSPPPLPSHSPAPSPAPSLPPPPPLARCGHWTLHRAGSPRL